MDVAEAVGATAAAAAAVDVANDINPLVALNIIALVAATSFAVEFLSWLFVYRTANYKRLVAEIESNCRKVAELKRATADKEAPKKKKKLDDALVKSSSEFAFHVRFKTGALTMLTMIAVYRYVTSTYAGVAVARLPFTPPSFVMRMTHSGLPGDDPHDCSALFIYVLCGMAVRANVTKFLNLGPSRAVTAATTPQQVTDKSKWE